MPALYLLFSHQLTKEQEVEVKEKMKIKDIYYLPQHLQNLWSNVPADEYDAAQYLAPIKDWLKERIKSADYILVQGEYGVTYYMVQWAFQHGCIPLYAATERKVVSEKNKSGKVEVQRVFVHKGFRKYQKLDI